MSITLDTPIQQPPLHGAPAATYGEVKIIVVGLSLVEKQLALTCQYGDTVDGDWVPSPLPSIVHTLCNHEQVISNQEVLVEADPAYDLFMVGAFASSTSTYLYDEVAESLYQYLIDEGIYAGTIV